MTRAGAIRLAALLGAGAILALAGAPHAQPAAASTPHRAAVIVDLGDGQVKVGCVSFTEDHLTGLEALDRASMAPVAQTYGGQGSAVCALCGKGCAAGSTCLTCKAPDYWAYYHHGAYSSAGAGRTEVRDGDTEAWKWGKGERPAAIPFAQVCPVPGPRPTVSPTTRPPATVASTTRPAPPTSAVGGDPGTGGAGSGGSGGGVAPTVPGASGPTVLGSAPPATSSPTTSATPSATGPGSPTTSARGSAAPPRSKAAAGRGRPSDEQSAARIGRRPVVVERAAAERTSSAARHANSVVSIASFAGVIVVVAGLTVLFRRRRVASR